MRPPNAPLAPRYALAVLGVVLAAGARLALGPVVGPQVLFAPFLLAVLLAAWAGGVGPALLAAALGGVSSACFLVYPRGTLAADQAAGLALYAVVGLGVALLVGSLRSAQRRSERRAEAVAQDREKLRVTLASIGDAVVVTDAQGRVASLNGVARELTGWAQEEARGRPLEEVFVIRNETTGRPVEDPVARVLREGRAVGLANHTALLARDGTRRPIDDSAAPIHDDQGALTGVILVFRDVSEQRQAERALRESEERHRLIAELTADYAATCRADDAGAVVLESVTDGFRRATGYTLAELQAKGGWPALIHPDDLPAVRHSVARWLAGRTDATEIRTLTRGGEVRWANCLGRAIDDPAGGPPSGPGRRFLVAAQDVTERRRRQEAAEERARLTAFGRDVAVALNQADTLPDMLRHAAETVVTHLHAAFARIWVLNDAGTVLELRASAGMYTHLDGPHSRVPVGKFKIGLIALERKPHLTNAVVGDPRVGDQAWARREGMVAFAGYPLLVADRLVGVLAMFSRTPLSEATLDAMASVAHGIASGIERRRAQDLLSEQRERLRVTLASIGDAVITTDAQGRVTFLNRVAEALTGWPQGEAHGQPLEAVFPICHEQTRRPVENPVARVLREGRAVGLANHTVLLGRDGVERPIDDSAAPIEGPDGTTLGVVLVFRDVTEHRRAEQELRQSEARKGAILETALDCIITSDQHGRVLEFNPAAERTFGYRRADVLGRDMADLLIPAAVRERHRLGMAPYLDTGEGPVLGKRVEMQARRADGTEFPAELAVTRISPDGPPQFTAYLRDISERKRGEAVLADQKRVLELLVGGAPLPDVLDALCEVIETHSPQQLIATVLLLDEDGQRLRSVAGRRAPADYARAVDGVRVGPAVGSCGTAAYRGEPVVVADIATDPLWADFKGLALGHGLRACWSTPVFSSQDKVLGTFAVYYPTPRRPHPDEVRLVDILTRTAGVAIERRRAEEALREADRRKDEFLATLAHELRNPLAPMRNALQVMQLAGGDVSAVAAAREMMERQMRHMVRLVDDLLDVSRITRGKLELRRQRVDLGAVLRTAVETSRPLIEAAGHALTTTLPPQPLFVDGDPVRLAQVFANLLNNAAKYTEPGGQIWLTAERQGSDAFVSVRDTGLGIPPEMLGTVFELFTQVDRTLEKAQGGLGIGLTLVRRLTEMHGGSVEARSEGPGRGSEFVVRLPVVLAGPARDEGPAGGAGESSRRRILVVDDNRDSAMSLALMLQLMGNEVRTAHDGLEAVQAAEVFRPDVGLLDIGLPRLNGYDAARRIRSQPWGRDVVLIAVTGWGQEDDRRRSKEAGFNFHMVKPVEPAALEKLLAGLLAPR
jgi:PAS domain S-box-containing protein